MSSPRYLRRSEDEDDYLAKRPSTTVDELRNPAEEESLHVTGLREQRLIALVIWLVILCILAVILTICNIMLITTLQMSHQGMKSIRIHTYDNPKNQQKGVSGHVIGPKAQTMNVDGTRVMISGGQNVTQFSLQDGVCKFDSQSNFKIVSSRNEKTMFSAQHPMINVIDDRIHKVSTSHIITNKIRAPVNQDLKIRGENVNLRGNEGINIESRRFHANASTALHIKTSADGTIRFDAPPLVHRRPLQTAAHELVARPDRFGGRLSGCAFVRRPAPSCSWSRATRSATPNPPFVSDLFVC
ncbi:Beta-sarcoglycan-like protein [Aphelenchoides fujianensis]|nr:Beta-sarcoglycan-like protein [Aphelenchoides fujianensis]